MNLLQSALLPCTLLLGQPFAAGFEPLLKTDFAKNPVAVGWELRGNGDQPFDGGWVLARGTPPQRCLVVRNGYWQTPAICTRPFHFYRCDCTSKAEKGGLWSAVFFDADGKEVVADVYDSIAGSADWQPRTFCIRGHAVARHVRLRFHADGQPLWVKAAAMEEVDPAAVAEWADGIAAHNPALRYTPPKKCCSRLPRTMKTLQQGGRLRIVMLGDSICNDTANSLYEALLKRVYPQAQIEVAVSVRGGAGCQYYKDENRVQDYVLRFKPDLVIIAGISHGYDAEAIRSVIRQIKSRSDCEFMVLTGAITPDERCKEGYFKSSTLTISQALENFEKFTARMRRMTDEEHVEFLDMRSAWNEYVLQSPRPIEWFLRDPIHGNSRGKQVVGRILFRYFEPQ
jgi:hypothetical protein